MCFEGLITENFKINSGNSATKRKQEAAATHNYKLKMNPNLLDFTKSPLNSPISTPSKRRILGEIQNKPSSPLIDRLKIQSPKSPLIQISPVVHTTISPLTSRSFKRSKISRIFEERTKFKMANKENEACINQTFVKLDLEEETRDCSFGESFRTTHDRIQNWSMAKLDFTDSLPTKYEVENEKDADILVPEKEMQDIDEFETLHDLEEEFEAENFDQCTKYEIISTDSPNIISRGRTSSSRKVNARNFVFGAPLEDSEQSTSFNRPAIRMLTFDDDFEFTSPAVKKTNASVKKSLKFEKAESFEANAKTMLNFEPNPLRHEKSDSSIGSMSLSPSSSRLRIFTSESTTSMESGFISELEEPFLEIEESNSPKISNFNELLSGQIKNNIITDKNFLRRPSLGRSLSMHPESKARVSLISILESPSQQKKNNKRCERSDQENVNSKRRRSNCQSPEVERLQRPVLHRAYSENNASIMSALARSVVEPDLIGDFSLPFALPLTSGDHSDLKSISCGTLAGLLRGEYTDAINDFQVIDCRYPYEYEGGHILGATNLYTPAQILTLVNKPLKQRETEAKRSILVFHCEFSLERGPKLSRFLRSSDREKNKENYPSLHYPEVYLLHEGYRAFYQQFPDLCSPAGYTAMLDPQHRHLLRKHRSVQQPTSSSHHRRNRLLL